LIHNKPLGNRSWFTVIGSLENCVASHLLKFVHFFLDYEGYKAGLYYLRNADQKEVDFLITVDKKQIKK